MNYHQLDASFTINSSMYIGGANPIEAELSSKAIKSAIMFWWRTHNYSKFNGDLARLHKQERKLFGSTEGASPLRMMLSPQTLKWRDRPWENEQLAYLEGQGLVIKNESKEWKEKYYGRKTNKGKMEYPRRYLQPGQTFQLRIISKEAIDQTVIDAIKIFGLLGNLGSRASRGFGSVQLTCLKNNQNEGLFQMANSKQGYLDVLTSLLNATPSDASSIPSFGHCRMDLIDPNNSAAKILSMFDTAFSSYRSNADGSTDNFRRDADWVMNKENVPEDYLPERVAFGLPHNYFVPIKDGDNIKADVEPLEFERRQSPLQFHIHKISEKRAIGVLIYFKSDFLPLGKESIQITRYVRQRGRDRKFKSPPIKMMDAIDQHNIITDFMSGKPRPQGKPKQAQARLLQSKRIFEDGKAVFL